MARKKSGKLTRTEVVPVRFDPKLKMAAELLAARERRTLSSLTEWVMERAVKEIPVTTDDADKPVTAWKIADECWRERDGDRIYRLAINYPELLTYDEKKIFDIMCDLEIIEEHFTKKGQESSTVLWLRIVNDIWPAILACANNEISFHKLSINYQEVRRLIIPPFYNPDIDELRELLEEGILNGYPNTQYMLKSFLLNNL